MFFKKHQQKKFDGYICGINPGFSQGEWQRLFKVRRVGISILLQLFFFSIIISGFIFSAGTSGLKSVLLGGSAWFVPGLYFFWRMQQVRLIFDNQKMLKRFFCSEAVKLLLSFSMIILILLTCNIEKKSFLVGYALMVLLSFLIPLSYRVKND